MRGTERVHQKLPLRFRTAPDRHPDGMKPPSGFSRAQRDRAGCLEGQRNKLVEDSAPAILKSYFDKAWAESRQSAVGRPHMKAVVQFPTAAQDRSYSGNNVLPRNVSSIRPEDSDQL